MRRFLNIKTLVSIVSFTCFACNDFLEENPDNRVELNSVDKAAQLLTNAYSSASYSFTEWMTDNVSYTFGTRKLLQHNQAYEWQDITDINQDTPSFYWTSTYEAIAHANEVLAVIDDISGDQKRKDAVKAEALLTRAYGHFMLVNLFAKHYDAATARRNSGIPYVEEPEKVFIKKYVRLTVEEVYAKIERDLLEGLKLADDSDYAHTGKYHFTRRAALAFASRFYLFKGDYEDCIRYSSELLGSDPGNFVKDIVRLLEEQINAFHFIQLYTSPNDNSNLLVIRQVTNFHSPGLGHWMPDGLGRTIFNSNPFGLYDVRSPFGRAGGNVPAFPAWDVGSGESIELTKFESLFERSSLTSNVGYNYTIFLGFRGEEVLLNRAEAYIIQNQVDLAMADLQVFASKRYEDYNNHLTVEALENWYQTGDDRLNALNYVFDERQKEFMHEGLRWFDLKRFGVDVRHRMPDGSIITLDDGDNRRALQIPQAAIDVGGLWPNPR